MTLYGSLIMYSTDVFSEHYCQTRAFLPPYIWMAIFPMNYVET
jgi:hypothetical protein